MTPPHSPALDTALLEAVASHLSRHAHVAAAYLLGSAPTATVRALTPCVLRHVADPRGYFRDNPDSALHMAVILARRLDSLNRYLVDIKQQFKDRADHLGMIDEVLDALMHKHPRDIPRRPQGD